MHKTSLQPIVNGQPQKSSLPNTIPPTPSHKKHIWWFPKIGLPPVVIPSNNRFFHYKPSSYWGSPMYGNPQSIFEPSGVDTRPSCRTSSWCSSSTSPQPLHKASLRLKTTGDIRLNKALILTRRAALSSVLQDPEIGSDRILWIWYFTITINDMNLWACQQDFQCLASTWHT